MKLGSQITADTDKIKAMIFHLNKTCDLVMHKIVFKNAEISYISEVKFLKINILNNLKWNTHIQFLCSKLKKVSCMISSLRADLSLFILQNIHFTVSIFDKVWHNFMGWGK